MQIPYRVNLSAKSFPLVPSDMARTVILPGYDQNFNRQVVSRADADKDVGIPQIYALGNILPVEHGFRSVRSRLIHSNLDGIGQSGHFQCLPVYTNITTGFISVSLDDPAYPFVADIYSWGIPTDGITPTVTRIGSGIDWGLGGIGGHISVATINGRCFLNTGDSGPILYEWVGPTTTLAAVAITVPGLTVPICVVSSNGYLVMFDSKTVYWSSPANPTNFTPSLVTGAGTQGVQEAKGRIIFALSVPTGILVFCENNIVLGHYTGNSRYPFSFKEVAKSGGISRWSDIAMESANGESQYAFTSSGLTQITGQKADLAFPDVQSFFMSHIREESNDGITFTRQTGNAQNRYIAYIADRYLCISYGTLFDTIGDSESPVDFPIFSYSLVYDTILQRWGKINVDHTALFSAEMNIGGLFSRTYAGIGYITFSGGINTLTFAAEATPLPSYLLLGKYQVSRSYLSTLQEIELENLDNIATAPSIYDVYSLDGKNQIYAPLNIDYRNNFIVKAFGQTEARNHSVLITSQTSGVNLNSLILTFSKGARI